jgi:hypothetical protein
MKRLEVVSKRNFKRIRYERTLNFSYRIYKNSWKIRKWRRNETKKTNGATKNPQQSKACIYQNNPDTKMSYWVTPEPIIWKGEYGRTSATDHVPFSNIIDSVQAE